MTTPVVKGHPMKILDIVNRVRQNHALEHATMHVLSRRNPYTRLMGRSTLAGFLIYGRIGTQEVADAATEALARMQGGEAYLAVHPRCGTNLAVTSVLAGSAAFGASLGHPRSKLERLPLALTFAMLGAIVAQPLAHQIQERITTTPELGQVYISDVRRQERGEIVVHRVIVGRG
jgi:hypothetical protein